MILTLAVSGYRSLRDLVIPLDQLTVITGANGTGKSSLYRSLRLLSEIAQGRAISTLATEGGLSSTLWAGPEVISRGMRSGESDITGTVRKGRVSLKLGFAAEDYGYAVDLGLPRDDAIFPLDPEIKTEAVWFGEELKRHNHFADRRGPSVRVRGDSGSWTQIASQLPPFDSMMTHAADPKNSPELLHLRDRMRNWRFYDQLRTDRDAPARRQMIGTRTPVLASNGSDLAAAIATIQDIGDPGALDAAIADAFPDSLVQVTNRDGLLGVQMQQRGLLRSLSAAELSDGTLRYILLAAALLTPRPPSLMVLNEPETSLHPELIPPLARLIAQAATVSQIIVVSHSERLTAALSDENALSHHLEKDTGATRVIGAAEVGWTWQKR
ncbi:MAG: AAA family ATPase [Pseudomonadota bacterium]